LLVVGLSRRQKSLKLLKVTIEYGLELFKHARNVVPKVRKKKRLVL
jgi:hypothetical protein